MEEEKNKINSFLGEENFIGNPSFDTNNTTNNLKQKHSAKEFELEKSEKIKKNKTQPPKNKVNEDKSQKSIENFFKKK